MKFWQIVFPFFPHAEKIREYWIANQLKKIPKNTKILDAGAGKCYYQRYCHHLRYVSQDFCAYNGLGDKKGIQKGQADYARINIISDIVHIPVKDNSFEAILCTEVFEHLPEPLKALKEFSRILKKGGILLLSAPFSSLTHYSPYYFYSGFSVNFYKKHLPQYGFKIKEIYAYGNYFDHFSLELIRTPLIVWRCSGFRSLPIVLIYLFLLSPLYFLFRLFGLLFPRSQQFLCFGNCLLAEKKKA